MILEEKRDEYDDAQNNLYDVCWEVYEMDSIIGKPDEDFEEEYTRQMIPY